MGLKEVQPRESLDIACRRNRNEVRQMRQTTSARTVSKATVQRNSNGNYRTNGHSLRRGPSLLSYHPSQPSSVIERCSSNAFGISRSQCDASAIRNRQLPNYEFCHGLLQSGHVCQQGQLQLRVVADNEPSFRMAPRTCTEHVLELIHARTSTRLC